MPARGGPARDGHGPKGEATKTAIIEAALRLFRQKGYEETTMRAIAAEAGVAVGNAYYYFGSKEHLIQGFYDRAGAEHALVAMQIIQREPTLEGRLLGLIESWLDVMAPYHSFAVTFFRNAADPRSPLSPFSTESSPARDASIALFRLAIEGSDVKPPKAVKEDLPELLWLYMMGHVLFWVHDRSENVERTRMLARRTVPLVVKAVKLAKAPLLRGIVEDVVALVGDLKAL